jgi:hypothetical protein
LEAVDGMLHDGERLIVKTAGFIGSTGAIALTDRRIMWVREGLVNKTSEDWPLSTITTVAWKSGLALGKITITAASTSAVVANVDKKVGARFVDEARARIGARATTATSMPPAAMSTADELGKLGELHAAGVLSDDEFAAAKARLLG